MKIRPLGERILLKLIRKNEHSFGENKFILVNYGGKEDTVIVEDLGPDVSIDIKIGDEIVLYNNAGMTGVIGFDDNIIVTQSDIMAVIEK